MLPMLEFGRTGHYSTRTLFGAASLSEATQEEADRTLELLQEYGVNHIDTAASYGDAELRIGPWMEKRRDDFFLATKTEMRTYQEAKEELCRSLERLRVDYVDLWQMHILVDPDEWETAMGLGGALDAFIEAKEEGLARYLGVTGHGVNTAAMHLRSLNRFDFDSVLLPYNVPMMRNPQYAADFQTLLKVCRERNVAVQTIKSIARGPWADTPQTRATWYEPLETQAEIDRAVHWVLANPGVFLNTVGDIYLLPKVLDAAARFHPLTTQAELEPMLSNMEMEPLFV